MATNHSEKLVAGAGTEGIVEIRRSAVLAILLVVGLFGGLVLWLMHSAHPAVASASPQTFGTLRGSDVSAINQNEAKHSDALPSAPRSTYRKAPEESTLDTSLVSSAQTPSQIGQPAPAARTDTTTATAPDSSAPRVDDATRLREQWIEDARDSQMDVKLGDDDSAKRPRNNQPPPAVAAQTLTTQTARTETPPSGPILQRGMIIPASLYTPIDSTVPGIVTAQIRQDVFDATHRILVIPRGSKLIGSYESAMTQGQARLFVGFDSVKLPNLRTIDLGSMPGVDLNGVAGLGGKVDMHTGRLFGNVLLLSVLAAGAELAQPRTSGCGFYGCQESAGQAIGSAVGSNVANAATQTYDRTLSQPPTMHVPAGYILNVMVERDLPLAAYRE